MGWTVAGDDGFKPRFESVVARGKSEHRRATDWLTARRGDPTTSATENRPADGFHYGASRRETQVMGETVGPHGLM